MVKNLLLDEGVLGKTLHSQEERRRGISLDAKQNKNTRIVTSFLSA
jgi:hypothetical protein